MFLGVNEVMKVNLVSSCHGPQALIDNFVISQANRYKNHYLRIDNNGIIGTPSNST